MRSIRLSLLAYFLGLLAVALGVASVLVYQSAQRSLREKEEVARKLIQAKYEEKAREKRARQDERLLTRAQGLARRVVIELYWGRFKDRELHGLGLLTVPASPNGHLLAPLWIAQVGKPSRRDRAFTPVAFEIYRTLLAEIKLTGLNPGDFVNLPPESQPGEYYQIDSNGWGRSLRSASLGKLSFPDTQLFARGEVAFSEFDEVELAPGRMVRRVRLKTSSARRVPVWSPPSGSPSPLPPGPGAPDKGKGRPHSRHRSEPPPMALVVQVAAETDKLDADLATLVASRDADLAALAGETEKALARQRSRLLTICGVTFAATVLGTFWLIYVGLAPLQRLSEAVSQVSAKDFRLPIEPDRLPRELRPIAQRLTGTLDLLKRAFAREKQATADISHELRTPLAALLTTTELALRKPRSAEQYRELLQDCRLSAQQMHQIVERLLTLARLDAGVDRLRAQAVDVAALAEQCAAVVRPLAEARGLQLAVHNKALGANGHDGPRLTTDPDKLREVLTNLLHNAIQYNKPDGAIALTLERHNGNLEVEVRDTGIGIAPEAREHIFERFYRADPSRNTDDLHAGLGLAIVKEYVDLMGGQITVLSEQGQGSTFRVQLPVRETPALPN